MAYRYLEEYRAARKVVVGVVGVSVLLIGALMIILPGPAVVVIPAGLAILATEFGWARLLIAKAKKKSKLHSIKHKPRI
jgi:tellurite resistance protein TerC